MEHYSKLKWPGGWFIPVIIFMFLFAAAFEMTQIGAVGYAIWAFGVFFILLGFYDFRRTGLITNLFIGLLFGSGSWHSLLAIKNVQPFSPATYLVHVVAVIFFFIFTWPILRTHSQLNKNAKRIFKRAAENVHEAAEGFTSRPFSAGRINFTEQEVLGFARHMSGSRFAHFINQKEKLVLAFSMGVSPLANPELQKVSYIAFHLDGNVTVHVSEYDYSRYRDQLTFDQLCASLAELFKQFLAYYQEGKESRIKIELES